MKCYVYLWCLEPGVVAQILRAVFISATLHNTVGVPYWLTPARF